MELEAGPTFSRDFRTGSSQKDVKYCWMKCGDVMTGCLYKFCIYSKLKNHGCNLNIEDLDENLFLEARPASALPSSFSTLSTIIKCSCTKE